ncbi:NAD-dependent epimerase/dehydratase family protein [Streptomyces sp. NPDC020330]|uniref:NAD-dependent epimerase/dehydratase family protein n=1 Tax=unclassified Streptomyces TaxID=2593676 RepID=UPI0037AEFA0C
MSAVGRPGPGDAVAVLGGTGWVGGHVHAAFARGARRVLSLARHPAPRLAPDAFRTVDLTSVPVRELARLLRDEGVRTVVNATDGANASDGWDRSEEALRRTNVTAVHRLLDAVALLPRPVRLVHIGTVHEFGPVPRGTLLGGGVEPRPAGAYGRSKLDGSRAVLDAAAATGQVDAVVLRVASVCGPRPSPASFVGHLLSAFRRYADTGAPARIVVADAARDFVDVRDVADAVVAAASPRRQVRGHAVTIGSGVATPVAELVTAFRRAAGLPPGAVAERAPDPGAGVGLGGDWVRTDVREAERLLDWRPRIGLDRSLRDTWLAAGGQA